MMSKSARACICIRIPGRVIGESSSYIAADDSSSASSEDKQDETLGFWYMSRKEIVENSPSRKDGIDWKKETFYRKSYCTFLQELGIKLKVPQITIATAIIFCHRFFLQHSHAKNDRRTIATVCMFLAGKVEETPRPLKDVILISYEIIHKKDPAAAQQIKQKEVFDQQKELILLGERIVLNTLDFSFNIRHPYKPLVEAIKKFNVAKNALAQVAWNFVNDGLRTSLFLQFKPHHIAAGAIFLAAKFLKVKLPSEGDKVWWQDFDVTPRQLEEVSNQMLELYEQNKVSQVQGSEVEGSAGGGTQAAAKAPSADEEQASEQASSRSAAKQTSAENQEVPLRGTENHINDGSAEMGSGITDHKVDLEMRDSQNPEQWPKDNKGEVTLRSNSATEQIGAGDQGPRECLLRYSPKDAIKMIDKDKVKAALKKRRKERGEMTLKKDVMDEDDLIEKELEDGIELAVENEKNKEGRQSWSEPDDAINDKDHADAGDVKRVNIKEQLLRNGDAENEQEVEMIDDASSLLNNRKRKKGSPLAAQPELKKQLDLGQYSNHAE
ncbi:unnamed protein product [Lupinus luteus]|uniref:B-like cyclin n=1 Tax=Lupinus luteus TaxID=3873 RepID=A0AAV1YKQ0_LUPLU